MSGLEALGLVCNIFAVVDFSIKTVKFCKAVYEGAALDADRLSAVCDSLETSTQDLRQSYYAVTEARTKAEQDILDLSQKCQVAARDLQEEVKFLVDGKAKGSLVNTVVVAIRKGWRKIRIQRREKSLEEFKALLETRLLFQILSVLFRSLLSNLLHFQQQLTMMTEPRSSKTQAIALAKQHEFATLDQQLQHFVTQYADGHTRLGDLVKAGTQTVTAATQAEGKRLEKELKEHTTAEVNAGVAMNSERMHQIHLDAEKAARLQKLLGSFKFPALNERRSHVSLSLEGTFNWILDDDTEDVQPWDNFLDWLKSESKKYWIQGKPGAGKSTLVKFLLHDARTQQAVDIWRPNTLMISHFFWKPGSILQRNIKGLLCSLMHQLGSASNAVLQSLFDGDTASSLQSKDSADDWSVEDLKSTLHETLSLLQRPVCIFIDGLDEVCSEDGSWRLMKVIDGLAAFPQVKICLASRPESRFKTHLDQQPQLRVQDLTWNDMVRYVDDKLSPFVELGTIPDSRSWETGHLRWRLVEKAEGVFLWLHLATNSIIRGLENGQTLDEVSIRLKDLSPNLADLYSDLWKRLNDDTPSHRQEGAHYLNIILENGLLEPSFRRYAGSILALGEVAIAAYPRSHSLWSNLRHAICSSSEHIPPDLESETLQSCHQTQKHILLRCAGLAEVVDYYIDDDFANGIAFRRQVKFIHRTAWDFLTDTEEGWHIRSYDMSSPESRHINYLFASLASRYLQPRIGYPYHFPGPENNSHTCPPGLSYTSHNVKGGTPGFFGGYMLLEANASFIALYLLQVTEAEKGDSISPGRRDEIEHLLTNPFGRIRYFSMMRECYRPRAQAISDWDISKRDISRECQHLDPRKLDLKWWASIMPGPFANDGALELVEGNVHDELAREGTCGVSFLRPVRSERGRLIGVEPSLIQPSWEDWEDRDRMCREAKEYEARERMRQEAEEYGERLRLKFGLTA
ncbi:hypothetical protein, variant [Gaeumannomyces tritici R3-111a-1]|uniref:Nephrocystin 3-like N-terminal domain-containing protein n=1 Tax=Gaeumannomyces tritici (strain R3-111a-1) TaxID=644352 RepID=J3PC21_GAET3|nr:hypothetical protein, variant [Gaeumannomyces tritici R3-111a-1]EJT71790.1 hypothetical protein, variant [Gaeumannomyces tritici R3-111a-1]